MKVRASIARAQSGVDYIPAGMAVIQPRIVDTVREFLVTYGVSRFDVGLSPFGGVTTYKPQVADIEGLGERPPILTQAMREVFRNLAPVLLMHGVVSIELTEVTDDDKAAIRKIWDEVNNG